jgi:kumamolisin
MPPELDGVVVYVFGIDSRPLVTPMFRVLEGSIQSETVWNAGSGAATGGGVSNLFDLPDWQVSAGVPERAGKSAKGRGVPDVAANADSRTGYQVLVHGKSAFVGGTSPAAQLWAALVCRLAQQVGRPLGLLQPLIYRDCAPGKVMPGFRDIVAGDNGSYAAASGWDPNTGLGSPDGTSLLNVLREAMSPGPGVALSRAEPDG